MVLKIHTLLSGKLDDHDLATLVLLLSSLALRQPDSEFYPVIASLGSLWGIMKNVPADNPILLAILQFAMLQLTCAGDTKFIRPGFNRPSIPKLPNSTFSPTISKFAEAVFSTEEGIWTELAAELTRICRKSGLRFGFHYEAADRGWFAGKFEDIVLLVVFELRSFLVAAAGLCRVETSSIVPEQYNLCIRGSFEEDDDKLIENISNQTRFWLYQWVNPKCILRGGLGTMFSKP